MAYWAGTLGVGPFFIKRNLRFAGFKYYGADSVSPTVSIALANSGVLQIELIQQHDVAASIYQDFLVAGRAGLQHVSSWVTVKDFEPTVHRLKLQGMSLAQECVIPSSGVRLAYFATERHGNGIIYEVSDMLEPGHYARAAEIRDAATNWSGNNAVREVSA